MCLSLSAENSKNVREAHRENQKACPADTAGAQTIGIQGSGNADHLAAREKKLMGNGVIFVVLTYGIPQRTPEFPAVKLIPSNCIVGGRGRKKFR